jgi:hypothetical protein
LGSSGIPSFCFRNNSYEVDVPAKVGEELPYRTLSRVVRRHLHVVHLFVHLIGVIMHIIRPVLTGFLVRRL